MTNIYLLRGLIREKAHWGDFENYIKDKFPQAKIHYLEIPGTGSFYRDLSPSNFSDMVKFLKKQYQKELEQEGEKVLITISLGGMLAKQWLELHDDFTHLVMINSSFRGISPLLKRLQPNALKSFLDVLFSQSIYVREKKILDLVCNSQKVRKSLVQSWAKLQSEHPVSIPSFFNQLLCALKFKPQKKPLNQSILVLNSYGDRLCHHQCSEDFQSVWGGELQTHPWAGHDLPADDPVWVMNKIDQFMHRSAL
jgi:predicted alpha/beta hydrolase family esterase